MALLDRTSIRREVLTAIAAGVCTALAVADSGTAWGQEPGDPAAQAETMAPDAMQMMMGAPSDDGDAAPLTGHGFLLDKGVFTSIDHPDAASGPSIGTVLFGVNNRGQVVGQYIDTDLRCHGLLRSRSTFTTIDDPGAVSYTGAVDINDRGQIVGFSDARIGFVACFAGSSMSASDPGATDR